MKEKREMSSSARRQWKERESLDGRYGWGGRKDEQDRSPSFDFVGWQTGGYMGRIGNRVKGQCHEIFYLRFVLLINKFQAF